MPVLDAWRAPEGVARVEFDHRAAPDLGQAYAFLLQNDLAAVMAVPFASGAGSEAVMGDVSLRLFVQRGRGSAGEVLGVLGLENQEAGCCECCGG